MGSSIRWSYLRTIIRQLMHILTIKSIRARRESRGRQTMTEQTHSKEIASEQGHWYTKSGKTCYEIVGKNGVLRPTTLRDARTLNLLPSVTSILGMLPKPALITWMKKQVLMSALTLTRLPDEPDEAYIARILADADEQARMAREKGTAIHGAIERFICGQSIEKEFTEDTEKLAWDEQKIQLEAYRHGLGMPDDTRMINVFISTSSPGLARVVEHLSEAKHWETFQACLKLWQVLKGYNGKV